MVFHDSGPRSGFVHHAFMLTLACTRGLWHVNVGAGKADFYVFFHSVGARSVRAVRAEVYNPLSVGACPCKLVCESMFLARPTAVPSWTLQRFYNVFADEAYKTSNAIRPWMANIFEVTTPVRHACKVECALRSSESSPLKVWLLMPIELCTKSCGATSLLQPSTPSGMKLGFTLTLGFWAHGALVSRILVGGGKWGSSVTLS